MLRLSIVWAVLLVLVACADDDVAGPHSAFWDSSADVAGVEALSVREARELPDSVWLSDAVIVAEVVAIDSTRLHEQVSDDIAAENPEIQQLLEEVDKVRSQTPITTTYRVRVAEWLRGEGSDSTAVTGSGGIGPGGDPFFLDGSFLLEPDRTYLLLLTDSPEGYWYHSARESFDLTDGVRVLNHETTRDLEKFEEMSKDEFVDYVGSVARSEPDADFCEFTGGDFVNHPDFGEGFVVSCSGSAGQLEVTAGFHGDIGYKTVPIEELSRIEVPR